MEVEWGHVEGVRILADEGVEVRPKWGAPAAGVSAEEGERWRWGPILGVESSKMNR